MESQSESLIQALRLAAIVENSDDAIVSKDVNGVVTSWNAAAERMFGWTAAEAIGQSILRLIIPPERHAEEELLLARIRSGERIPPFETVRCRRDGERLDVSLTLSPIRTPEGKIVGASKIARDITERKRTERALAEARAEQADLRRRLMTILEASGALLTSPRLEDVLPAILVVSRQVLTADAIAVWHAVEDVWRVAASHGLSAAFTSQPVQARADQDLRDGDLVVIESPSDRRFLPRADAFRAEGIQSMLVVPLHAAGAEMRALVAFYYRTPQQFGTVERESASGLGRLASAVIATAYLYEAQRRRRLESEFIADIAASLVASRDYHDSLARIASRAVPRLADWCVIHLQDEAEGALELVAAAGEPGTDPAIFERAVRASSEDGPEAFSVDRVVRAGAPLVIPRLSAEPCEGCAPERRAAAAQLGEVALVSVPLIAYTRTLGALTLAHRPGPAQVGVPAVGFAHDLADRVALAIDNRLAYEEARNANRLKDEFLANLSHELRTPLNAIVGYAQMLKKGAMPEDRVARAYDVLDKNARALTQIVEDVLDISRIVSGKIRLHVEPVSVEAIVQHSVETVQPGADAKGVRIEVVLPGSKARVAADPDRLQQIFWNLLSNALKFTPRDGRIGVRLAYPNGTCEVTISDNGIGIEPRFLPHIFERFRQGDSRYGREHGGLGLGLAIARQIVELHGGTISAASEGIGRGATFKVTLPTLGH